MKLRLHWTKKYEMVREYPTFELDSEKFPELELEMVQVHHAGSLKQQQLALADLEHKMQRTTQRGETIMNIYGPSRDENLVRAYRSSDEESFLAIAEEV